MFAQEVKFTLAERKAKIGGFKADLKAAKTNARVKAQEVLAKIPESRRSPFALLFAEVAVFTPAASKPKTGHRQRYRFQSTEETKTKAEFDAATKELENHKAAIGVLAADFKDDAELMLLVAELKSLQEIEERVNRDFGSFLASLETPAPQKETKEQVASTLETIARGTESEGVSELAKAAAEKIRAQDKAEDKYKKASEKADASFKSTMAETIKEDRALSSFVGDVRHSGIWMIEPNTERGARDYMTDIEAAQNSSSCPDDLESVTNLFCYSTNQGRIVWCKKISGKWDFHRYYVPCSYGVAFEFFGQCTGRTMDHIPASTKDSGYTTTKI